MVGHVERIADSPSRRSAIGGSDARIIMGNDEAALLRLWREKRGDLEPEDLSDDLIVQLGLVTEALNRHWYERNTGQTVECVQHRLRHPVLRWMGATLDGLVQETGAVFEAKFMLPWSFSEEAAAEKHMAQLQHNMWVTNSRLAALSVITGAASGSRSRSQPIRSTSTSCQCRFNFPHLCRNKIPQAAGNGDQPAV
jgi:predicted phage-related endonuclease